MKPSKKPKMQIKKPTKPVNKQKPLMLKKPPIKLMPWQTVFTSLLFT